MSFKVIAVWDGNTIEIEPDWEYDDKRGSKVQATGYAAPSKGALAMNLEQRLSALLLNKKVDLQSPVEVSRNRLVAAVYINGINLADYFSEYKQQAQAEIEVGQEAVADGQVESESSSQDGEEAAGENTEPGQPSGSVRR
jgi:hypothetical protein